MNQVIARARSVESCRPLSPDERLAQWAARLYGEGHHRAAHPQKINCPSSTPPYPQRSRTQ